MSNKAMTHVWENSQQKGNALLVLLAIADMADDFMVCYPGKGYLAKKCRLANARTVRVILKKLEEDGEIQIYHRRTGERNSTNVYRIVMPSIGNRLMTRESSIGDRLMTPESLPGDSWNTTPGDSWNTTLVSPESPKPSFNPKNKPIEKQEPLTPFDLLIKKDQEL
jgi:helix-turn-helix protein